MPHLVNHTVVEIKVSESRQAVEVWANGNSEEYPVDFFGCTSNDSEVDIVDAVIEWLHDEL